MLPSLSLLLCPGSVRLSSTGVVLLGSGHYVDEISPSRLFGFALFDVVRAVRVHSESSFPESPSTDDVLPYRCQHPALIVEEPGPSLGPPDQLHLCHRLGGGRGSGPATAVEESAGVRPRVEARERRRSGILQSSTSACRRPRISSEGVREVKSIIWFPLSTL